MTMAGVIDLLSLVVAIMGIISAAVALWLTRRRQIALAVLLDLLTAAGLLRLAAEPDFIRAATAAVVLVIRRMVSWALSLGRKDQWQNHEFPHYIRLAPLRERLTGRRTRPR
jgi:hypothetical protein